MHYLSQLITVKTALVLTIILTCTLRDILYAQDRPVADFSYEGNCTGAPIRFKDLTRTKEGELPNWWWWDFGDQHPGKFNYAYKPEPEHTYLNPGIYRVRLIVGMLNGMRDTVSHQVEIIPRPQPPLIEDTVICFDNMTDMMAQSRDANQIAWYRNIESLLPVQSDDSILTTDLLFSDTLYAESVSPQQCRSERVAVQIVAFSKESATIILESENLSLPEAEVKFAVNTPYEISSWAWDFGDSDSALLAEPVHIYTIPGIYEVGVELTNDKGCKLELEREITIRNPSFIQFSSAFSPNGDGFNDKFEIEAESLESFQIQIFDQERNLVFESSDKYFAWDGWSMEGKLQSEGIYEFVVRGTDLSGNTVEERHQLSLIR